ncbi:MAG: GntR family transcriptional regulator [Flavobacteriales bacterium]|nr:GntR family transcriptional regulator [Flavobacteriales bacterium]
MEIGRSNTLELLRITSVGAFLGDAEGNDVLLPTKWIPEGAAIGDHLEVFVYTDSEDRPIATTLTPNACVNEFGFMRVNQVNDVGAFLDWGIEKDLFVPFREQRLKMEEGRSYVVYLYFDIATGRVAASNRTARFLDNETLTVNEGDAVDLLVFARTDLGYKVIVNNIHSGIIYGNESIRPLNVGEKHSGYVRKVREDNKLDISLQPIGYAAVEPNSQHVLDLLKANKGFLPYTDRTDPDIIRDRLGMSKKVFKKAVGLLYRERRILIEDTGLRLVK